MLRHAVKMNNINLVEELILKFTDLSIKTVIDSLALCILKGRKEIFATLYDILEHNLLAPDIEVPKSIKARINVNNVDTDMLPFLKLMTDKSLILERVRGL